MDNLIGQRGLINIFLFCSEKTGQTEPNNEEIQTSIVRLRKIVKIVYNKQ